MATKKFGQLSRGFGKAMDARRMQNKALIHQGTLFFREMTIPNESEIKDAIREHTEISCQHLTPELKLHLLTPNCSLYHLPISENESTLKDAVTTTFRDPFWSIYWPGGQALTRFILDRKESLFKVENDSSSNNEGNRTRILDLGAGCGASAIAAKMMGAHTVIANDIDAVACVAMGLNAAINDVELQISNQNLISEPYNAVFDVIFIGDLLYDEEIAKILVPWLEQALNSGARIYLGDPGRHGLTEDLKKKLKMEEKYSLPENVRKENHGFDTATVWQFLN